MAIQRRGRREPQEPQRKSKLVPLWTGALMTKVAPFLLCTTLLLAIGLSTVSATKQTAPLLFEDFTYANKNDLRNNGWIIRTEAGWPGIPGATWWEEGVSILKDPDNRNN